MANLTKEAPGIPDEISENPYQIANFLQMQRVREQALQRVDSSLTRQRLRVAPEAPLGESSEEYFARARDKANSTFKVAGDPIRFTEVSRRRGRIIR